MNKAPTIEEIYQAFEKRCGKVPCSKCRFMTLGKEALPDYMCAASYTHAVLTGEMTLEDSFEKEV